MSLMRSLFSHQVLRNVGALSFVQLINYSFPVVVFFYLFKTLGKSEFAVVIFNMSVIQVLCVLVDFGFNLSATQRLSIIRKNKKLVARIISAIYVVKLGIFCFALFFLILYANFTSKYELFATIFFLSPLPVLGICFQSTWFFLAIEEAKYISLVTLIVKVLSLLLIFFWVSESSDYYLVPALDGFAQIIGAAILVYVIHAKGYRISIPKVKDLRFVYAMTFRFFLSRVAVTSYVNGGVLVLGLFSTPSALTIYALAERCYLVMQQLFSPVIQAIYPHLAKTKNVKFLVNIFRICLLGSIIISVIGFSVSPSLVQYYFPEDAVEIVKVLGIFLVTIVVYVVAVFSGYPLSVALGEVNVANSTVLVGAITYSLCIAIFAYYQNISPVYVAISILLSEISVVIARAFLLWPKLFMRYSCAH